MTGLWSCLVIYKDDILAEFCNCSHLLSLNLYSFLCAIFCTTVALETGYIEVPFLLQRELFSWCESNPRKPWLLPN